MRQIEYSLIVGVCVHSRHEAALNTKRVMEHLDNRSQAVRRARRIGNHAMLSGIIIRLIDSEDDCEIDVLRRSGNDHILGASFQMRPLRVLHR